MRVSPKQAGLGLCLSILVVSVVPAFAGSRYTYDNHNKDISKFKVALDCRVFMGLPYWTRTPDDPNFWRGFGLFEAEKTRTLQLKGVKSRTNPTATERATIEARRDECLAWIDKTRPQIVRQFCKKWKSLEPWQRHATGHEIWEAARPLEQLTIASQSHPPYRYDVPAQHSYYNQNWGREAHVPFDANKECR